MTKLAYTTCIRPAMTYASFAFANSLTKKQIGKLNTVQSLALRMTCNARRGTPLNGLEIILDVPPLDLYMKGEATKSVYRLIGTNEEDISTKGHIQPAMDKLTDIGLIGPLPDKMDKHMIWKTISKSGNDITAGFRCYTDGSKTTHGTGAGFCKMRDNKVIKTMGSKKKSSNKVSLDLYFSSNGHTVEVALPLMLPGCFQRPNHFF